MKYQTPENKFAKISLLGWWLFDFAFAIPAVIGGLYFTKWFTENLGANSELLNLLFLVSTLFVILTGKWVGRNIDAKGYRVWMLLSCSIAFLTILLLFWGSQTLPPPFLIPLSFVLFLLFLFGYQVGRICHNVYLRKVIPEELQSKMSGYGIAANWAGSIVGILLTIPILTTHSIMYGRELTFLIAAVAYGIITPIALFFMLISKEDSDKLTSINTNKSGFIKSLLAFLGISFIIYFLLFDVMTIVQRNLPSFLSHVFKMSDDIQAFAFLIILFSAMIGGMIAAKILKYTNSNFWLKVCSFSLGISIILITLNNQIALWISFVTAGLSYGILESAIRINFMGTFSAKNAGENFGLLAIVERTSGIVGPLLWIISFSLFTNMTQSYIVSMLVMSGLAFCAFILLFFKRNGLK